MAERPWLIPFVVLVAITLVAAGATGAYLYAHNKITPAKPPLTVQAGDNVTVNYIGIFGSGPEQGKVFDTSIYSVAVGNGTYPKSLQFHYRGSEKNYTTLPVHIGSSTPSGGYSFANQSFIQVVTGFWQGMIGMQGNTSRVVTIPPSLGYGAQNPACLRSLPLVVHVPIYQTLSGSAFSAMYPGVLATTGASFNDPTYGYQVVILNANSTSVSIQRIAYVGETSSIQGWPAEVTNLTTTANGSGQITVRNLLTPADAGHIAGHSSNGLCTASSNGQFIITAVNYTGGVYVEDFNQEVAGETLLFVITTVDIYAPVAPIA